MSASPHGSSLSQFHPQPLRFFQSFNATLSLPHTLSPNSNSFHNLTHYYTNESKHGNRTGFAYVIRIEYSFTDIETPYLSSQQNNTALLSQNDIKACAHWRSLPHGCGLTRSCRPHVVQVSHIGTVICVLGAVFTYAGTSCFYCSFSESTYRVQSKYT